MTKRGLRKSGLVAVVLVMVAALLTACYPPGSVVVGKVLFANGAAAANVEVAAYTDTTGSAPVTQTVTNVGGDFALNTADVPDGDYFVRIGPDWWTGSALSTDAGDATVVTVAASGSPVRIDAQVGVAATITGGLVDADNDPLVGQLVGLQTLDADLVAWVTTDATGQFGFSLATAGAYRIVVNDPSTDGLTMIGDLSYTVAQGQMLDVGTLSVFTTPPPMRMVGTRNFVGGVASQYSEQPGLIRADMDPGIWAAIEAPGTSVESGDLFSPRCLSRSLHTCTSTGPNPAYDPNGQYYTLDIDSAVPHVLLQVFDAGFDKRANQKIEAGDGMFAGPAGPWTTNYEVLAPDATPDDPTDNPVVAWGTCGDGFGNVDNSGVWHITNNDDVNAASSFKNEWRTLCTLENPGVTESGSPYLLRVWSSADSILGNAVNRFALRAVGAHGRAVDSDGYPLAPVADEAQPRLAARSHATVAAVYQSGSTTYPLVEVEPGFAGHTLVLDLFDIGEYPVSHVTVNTPFGPQADCLHTSRSLDGTDDGTTTIPAAMGCTIRTDYGTARYNGRILTVQIPIPSSYSCDMEQRPHAIDDATFNGNGCWWSLSYEATLDIYDITTWSARVV